MEVGMGGEENIFGGWVAKKFEGELDGKTKVLRFDETGEIWRDFAH